MEKFQEKLRKYEVKLISTEKYRKNFIKVYTHNFSKNHDIIFEAWDDKCSYILKKCLPGDTLSIEAYDYVWPGSEKKVEKIYKVTNLSNTYKEYGTITNTNNTRGYQSDYISFCVKDQNKYVTYCFIRKNSKLINYVIKGKKCLVQGTSIGCHNKHKVVVVDSLQWI